ncbi:MAG: Ig-like domain-containing protein [archaeon]
MLPPPSVNVTYPNGGETLTGGSTVNITWTSSNLTTGVIRIYFYNGSTLSLDTTISTLSKTSYAWTVPNINPTNCKIIVGNYNPTIANWIVYDDSDAPFSITTP